MDPSSCDDQTKGTHKGKGKAHPQPSSTERTPLLGSHSRSRIQGQDQAEEEEEEEEAEETEESSASHAAHRSLRSRLVVVFLVSLSICVCVLVVLVITAYSYVVRLSHTPPEELLDRGWVFRGPDRVDVLNVTDAGGIWVSVEGRMGIDAGAVVGLKDDSSLLSSLSSRLARWGIREIGHITLSLSLIHVFSGYDKNASLASVVAPVLELPLTADHPPINNDFSWLTKMSVPLLVSPTQAPSVFTDFTRDSWAASAFAVTTYAEKAVVQAGKVGDLGWRQKLKVVRSGVRISMRKEIPSLPGFPLPGRNGPFPSFGDLVTLESVEVTTGSNDVSLYARATVVDPLPLNFDFTTPSLPFIVSIPSSMNDSHDPEHIPFASVVTEPFSLTHPKITLSISGVVLPISHSASPLFSTFIAAYLEGKSNPISLSTPIFPELSVDAEFPAPKPKPDVLRGVTIHDMKIKPSTSGTFLASGVIYVHVVLPKGMNVELNVTCVLPNVLVFDGEPPALNTERLSLGGHSLPDPLPDRAFARIRPDDWLDSVTEPEESEDDEGSAYAVSAKFYDVPLEVLPGREKEFRAFVSKVIFGSRGAVAGLLGTVDIAVEVNGLKFSDGGREMALYGLPFKGSVRVRKSSFLNFNFFDYFRRHRR